MSAILLWACLATGPDHCAYQPVAAFATLAECTAHVEMPALPAFTGNKRADDAALAQYDRAMAAWLARTDYGSKDRLRCLPSHVRLNGNGTMR